MKKALISNIQKFSTEDGPGIRTTVFFKGCPLKCIWCHNPEGIGFYLEIMWDEDKCIRCGECIKKCTNKAIKIVNNYLITDKKMCSRCGRCVDICPEGARELVGKYFTLREIVNEVKKDKIFYDKSGGGVTVSGGEPSLQWGFTRDLLRECKKLGIHTALDTSGYVEWSALKKILEFTDLILYDLKLIDEIEHQKYTGAENQLILRNIKKVSKQGVPIWIRIPIIPKCTDRIENIMALKEIIKKLNNVERIDLLAYHTLGVAKYKRLGLKYLLEESEQISDKKMEEFRKILDINNLNN